MNPYFLRALADMLFNQPTPKATVTKGGKVVTGTGTARESTRKRSNRQSGARTERRLGGRDRMTVSGQRNQNSTPRGAQGPRQAPVQGPYQRTPNIIGERAPNTTQPPRTIRGDQFLSSQSGYLTRPNVLRTALKVLPRAAALWAISEGLFPRPTGDGELRGQPSRPNTQQPKQTQPQTTRPQPVRQSLSPAALDFDRTFAKARAAGLDTFTWRGNVYNTLYAGE